MHYVIYILLIIFLLERTVLVTGHCCRLTVGRHFLILYRQDSDSDTKSRQHKSKQRKIKHIEHLEIACFELDSEDIREISKVVNKQVS